MSPNFEMGQPFEKMVQNFENGLIFSALHLQMTHVWFSRGQYFEQRTDKYDLTIEFWRMVKNLPAFVPSVFRPCVCKMCKIAVRWYAEFPDIPKTPSTPHISTIYSRCPKDIPKICPKCPRDIPFFRVAESGFWEVSEISQLAHFYLLRCTLQTGHSVWSHYLASNFNCSIISVLNAFCYTRSIVLI